MCGKRLYIKKCRVLSLAWLIGASVALADNMILDFETIKRIELNLKPNQTLMIDHRRGALLGIMEVMDNGKIRQLPIPKELLGKSEADVMGENKDTYTATKSNFGNTQTTIYHKNIKGVPKLPTGKEKSVESNKKTTKPRDNKMEWDKSKIIYEQKEQVLDIMR